MPFSPLSFIISILAVIVDVFQFWTQRIQTWWRTLTPQDAAIQTLQNAREYEEWQEAAAQLDRLLGHDLWRHNPASKWYDYRLISSRLQALNIALQRRDFVEIVSLLRSGLVRNLGNITLPRLYSRAYGGTKLLIEDYVTQVTLAIDFVAGYPQAGPSGQAPIEDTGFPFVRAHQQSKVDILHDTRQAFGRTALVLQGGSILALCHLGVIKALYLAGLLPRIVVGTAAGALIAPIVGVYTDDELEELFSNNSVDLTAFERDESANRELTPYDRLDIQSPISPTSTTTPPQPPPSHTGWLNMETLARRLIRYTREGHFLDKEVLEKCIRENIGEFTFDEAYSRTSRVVNITVTNSQGVPVLLNYLTAPHVLIWSAALASHVSTSTSLYAPAKILCKDITGEILEYNPNVGPAARAAGSDRSKSRSSRLRSGTRVGPLSRVAEMFNVNHFIISQARPYLAPFLRSELYHPPPPRQHPLGFLGRLVPPPLSWMFPSYSTKSPLLPRLIFMEIHHRLHQLDILSFLPAFLRRLLLDEAVPSGSPTSVITIVPELYPRDVVRLLDNPSPELVAHFISRGERAIWPAICALKVRCSIEVELDRGYQGVRRRKPFDQSPSMLRTTAATAAAFQAARAARRARLERRLGSGDNGLVRERFNLQRVEENDEENEGEGGSMPTPGPQTRSDHSRSAVEVREAGTTTGAQP